MSKEILPGAGPFFYEGNEVGIVFIHGGGGGSCADLKSISQDLHQKKGYTIHVPLLPGYGTTPKQLKNTTVEDFKDALHEEIASLKKKCEKVIVGGHSMGGALTLIMAAHHSLDGIFTISAPIGWVRPYSIIKMFWKAITHLPYFPVEYDNLKKETDGKWVGYKKIPINMASKIGKLFKEMKETMKKVICPALIMQGWLDSAVKPESMDTIYNEIGSENKKKLWLENNDHPILDSPDHEKIVSEIINFISNI
jgi:carboxylesterase